MNQETTDTPAGLRTVADLDLKPALEAVLMVVDEPATEEHLAKILERPKRQIKDALRELADEYTVQAAVSSCGSSRAAGGSTPGPSTRRPSNASSSTGSRPGSPRPPLRPWRSSPTASRSADPGSQRSAE